MSKIGILTFHNNENRGAILQAYSLREALDNVFSEDVEIVEYRTKAKEQARWNNIALRRRPWKALSRFNDRQLVESFLSSQIPTSSESLVTNNQDEAVEWIESQDYSLLVTGSDEIWKVQTGDNDGLFSRFFPDRPFPNLYFLDPRLTALKTAYAASANTVNLGSLTEGQRNKLKEHLSTYDHISVRDGHTEELLDKLDIGSVWRVPDPTLLIDIPTGDAAKILRENGVNLDKPILGFHGSRDPVFEDICDYYRSEGYQIVTMTSSSYADVELKGEIDAFEYYAMYDYFDMVITSSLHSTIFSLKNRTPFATIDVSSSYSNLESKTYSLLEEFSLLARHIDAVNGDVSEFYDRTDQLEQDIDKIYVENRIETLQERGYNFLKMVKEDFESSKTELNVHETDD